MKSIQVFSFVFFVLCLTAYPQFVQQSNKLIGTGRIGTNFQGVGVALSADGNTLLSGGCIDNASTGAMWVFTRTNGIWSQQGTKLVGTGAQGNAWQAYSVAISADGNTALSGGLYDNHDAGAVWVFTRTNGVWSQMGRKLTGTNNIIANIGYTVAISADGKTAMTGGFADNNYRGAAWIFTNEYGVWLQQGNKLFGAGNTGNSYQGYSVALSADGNTAVSGAPNDANGIGAVWVFTRTNGVWSQQGVKLVGTNGGVNSYQGYSVSISADGNTIIVGGPGDNAGVGAVWVFTRSSGAWIQLGEKITCPGIIGQGEFGYSVSISGDGKTFISGCPDDDALVGGAWIFKYNNGVWNQVGPKLIGSGAIGVSHQGYAAALSSDAHTAAIGTPWDNANIGAAWAFIEYAADGSGVMTFTPNSSFVSLSSLNYILTYTASPGGLLNGEIDISIPSGWSIGSVTSSIGSAAIVDGIIKITGVTLDGGSQLIISLNNTTNGNTPGENIFPVSVKTTAGGVLTPMVSNPSVYLNILSNNTSLAITSPVGGERWKAGSMQYISWERKGVVLGSFLLEYSTDNGATWIKINKTPIAGVTRYPWIIPEVNSTNCLLRISGYLTHKLIDITRSPFCIYTGGCQTSSYPNPFNPTARISFFNNAKEFVTLRVFNCLGQQIIELVNKELTPGKYEYEFDGSKLPSGVYIYNLTIGGKSETRKMILAK